ncbi:hypothetical protein NW759_008697 [Fusarium solani]|nr:hypothetical protein NW759_008697 [Fusarium solani]
MQRAGFLEPFSIESLFRGEISATRKGMLNRSLKDNTRRNTCDLPTFVPSSESGTQPRVSSLDLTVAKSAEDSEAKYAAMHI